MANHQPVVPTSRIAQLPGCTDTAQIEQALLQAFRAQVQATRTQHGIPIDELAQDAGISLATAYRILGTPKQTTVHQFQLTTCLPLVVALQLRVHQNTTPDAVCWACCGELFGMALAALAGTADQERPPSGDAHPETHVHDVTWERKRHRGNISLPPAGARRTRRHSASCGSVRHDFNLPMRGGVTRLATTWCC